MHTPFGVIPSAVPVLRICLASSLVALSALPSLARDRAESTKSTSVASKAKKAPKTPANDPISDVWVGAKPVIAATAAEPAAASAPVRAPLGSAPALLPAPAPANSASPAKSVETKAIRPAAPAPKVAPVVPAASKAAPVETLNAGTAGADTKPLIFTNVLSTKPARKKKSDNSTESRQSAKRETTEKAKSTPAAEKSIESEAQSAPAAPRVAPVAPPVRAAEMPVPAVAAPVAHKASSPSAKSPAKDLDDLPLSSVLSKNTAGEGKTQRSTGNLVADVLTKLGFVILLGLGAAAGWKKFQGQSFSRPVKPQHTAEVATVLPLGPQRSVHLLRIGSQTLVVASSPQNISLLATLDDAQAAEGVQSMDDANETEPDFQALIGHLVQSGAAKPLEKVDPTKVEPVRVETLEETGGRVFTGLKGSLFQAATPVAGSRNDA